MKQKDLAIDLRSINTAARTARFIASTDAVDSYGEVVKQNWLLDRFNTNPVVLYNHMRSGSELPIGTATVAVASGRLECEITFASEKASPLAEQVWCSVQERVLRAVSVGFKPRSVYQELRDGEEVWVLDGNELFEISVTPIGANPEALLKSRADVAAENRQIVASRVEHVRLEEARALAKQGKGPLAPASVSPRETAREEVRVDTGDHQLLAEREALWQRHLAAREAASPSAAHASADAAEMLMRALDGIDPDFDDLLSAEEEDERPAIDRAEFGDDGSAEAAAIFERSFDGSALAIDDAPDGDDGADAADLFDASFDDEEAAQ